MIRLRILAVGAGIALVLLWHECGENLGVFCYRIASCLLARARPAELVPVRVREKVPFACSSPFEAFFTRSTMWKV